MSVEAIEFISGPLVSEFSREAAEAGLQHHPKVASGSAYALHNVEGRWVAAIATESASPFGGPADQDEESPGPKSVGPGDTTPDPDDDPGELKDAPEGPEDSDPEVEGLDDDTKSKSDSDKTDLKDIAKALKQLGDALGIPLDLGHADPSKDGPEGLDGPPIGPGGPDNMMPPPPNLAPEGPVGAPAGKGDIQTIHHEKALKPGEVPPGGTPVGAPAFSHVRADHPWKHVAGVIASIPTENYIGNRPMSDVHAELVSLTNELGGGYRVAKLEEDVDASGRRIARAVISMH